MPLLQGPHNALLVLRREILKAVNRLGILLVAAELLDRLVEVRDDLGSHAAPAVDVSGNAMLMIVGESLPVSPHEGLDSVILDPGAVAKLALLDLDFLILAFLVLAAGSGGGGLLWGLLVGTKNGGGAMIEFNQGKGNMETAILMQREGNGWYLLKKHWEH